MSPADFWPWFLWRLGIATVVILWLFIAIILWDRWRANRRKPHA